MSNIEFNGAASDQTDRIFRDFTERAKKLPHYFRLITPLGYAELNHENREKKSKLALSAKLKENLEKYPDAPEVSDWANQLENLGPEIEQHTINAEKIFNTKAKEYLATLPLKELGLQESDFVHHEQYPDRIAFLATIPMQTAFAIQKLLPSKNEGYGILFEAYNPSLFSQNLQSETKAVANTFRELISYMQSLNIPGQYISEALDHAMRGHVMEIEKSRDYSEFSRALETLHRGDSYRREQKPLDLHYARAVLASNATWKNDQQAQSLLNKLDFFLQRPGNVHPGTRSDCLEQQYRSYIDKLFDQSLSAFENDWLKYDIQLDLTEQEKNLISQGIDIELGPEKEEKQVRIAQLQKLYNDHEHDPLFSRSLTQWKEEYQSLEEKFGARAIRSLQSEREEVLLDEKYKALKEAILNSIQLENLDIVPQDDIKDDPANYQSSRILFVWSKPEDIQKIKALPEVKDLWIRIDSPVFQFIDEVNGIPLRFPYPVDIMGMTEYAPHSVEITPPQTKAPSIAPN